MGSDKINATRFCDLQGMNDFDRNIIERKYRGQKALYTEWYNTLKKEGFEVGELKKFEEPEKKQK